MTLASELKFRPAVADDAEALGNLAFEAKASWGYSQQYMEFYRPVLSVTREYINKNTVLVLERRKEIAGFFALADREGERMLDYFFVSPSYFRSGIGRMMWEQAVLSARRLGWGSFLIHTDPHALGFYLKLNCRLLGVREAEKSPVTGLKLPLFVFYL